MLADPRWLDDREAALWQSLLEVIRRLQAATEHQLLESGLSGAEFAVLVPLAEAPDGVLRARELGRALRWDRRDRSRLAHQLRRMERRGLIARTDCADDARATMVAITDAGRRAIGGAAPGHVETVRAALFDKLDAADVDALAGICARLLGPGTAPASADGCCGHPPPDQDENPQQC